MIDLFDPPTSGAVMSECGRYRYLLWRRWDDLVEPFRPMGFIMLNPSIADASLDDQTVRRCKGFARREACTAINVVNLFAWRATDPRELAHATAPIGRENLMMIERILDVHVTWETPLVAAWGASADSPLKRQQVEYVTWRAEQRGVPLWCLGTTKSGAPRHPSRLHPEQPLQRFEGGS